MLSPYISHLAEEGAAEEVVVEKTEETKEKDFNADAFRKGEESTEATEEVVETKEIKEEAAAEIKKPEEVGAIKEEVVEEAKVSSMWELFSTAVSTDGNKYELPEAVKTRKKKDGSELSKEEEFNLLVTEISKNTEHTSNPTVNALVKNIIAASTNEGFDLGGYIDTFKSEFVDTTNMSVDEQLVYHYKSIHGKKGEDDTTGMTDEQIKAEVNKLSEFGKRDKIKEIEDSRKEVLSKQAEEHQKTYNLKVDSYHKEITKASDQLMTNYLKKVEGASNIDGIELGEADKVQYLKELPSFFEKKLITNEKGYSEVTSEANEMLNELMANPESSLAFLPYLWMMKHGKLRGYTSGLKKAVKETIEGGLKDKPDVTTGVGTQEEFSGDRFRKGDKTD